MPWIAAAGAVVAGALGANASKDAAKESAAASKEAVAENRRESDLVRSDTALSRSIGQGALYQLANTFGVDVPNQAVLSNLDRQKNRYLDRIARAEQGLGIPGGDDLKAAGYSSVDEWLSGLRKKAYETDIKIQKLSSSSGAGGQNGLYDNLEMDPGYDFRLSEGEKAMQRMQSAGGTRYGGGALRSAMRYGQDYASNEFSNAVNRRNSELGYLFSLAGFGQQGIATAGQAGAASAANNSNILMQNAANQGAYGMAGASAINNAVQGGLQNYYTQQLLSDYNKNPYTLPQSHEMTH